MVQESVVAEEQEPSVKGAEGSTHSAKGKGDNEQEFTLKEAEKQLLRVLEHTQDMRIKVNIDSINRKFNNAHPHDILSIPKLKDDVMLGLRHQEAKELEKTNTGITIFAQNYQVAHENEPEKLFLFFSSRQIPVAPLELQTPAVSAVYKNFCLNFKFGGFDITREEKAENDVERIDDFLVGLRAEISMRNGENINPDDPDLTKLQNKIIKILERLRDNFNDYVKKRNRKIEYEVEMKTLGPISELVRKRRLVGIKSPEIS